MPAPPLSCCLSWRPQDIAFTPARKRSRTPKRSRPGRTLRGWEAFARENDLYIVGCLSRTGRQSIVRYRRARCWSRWLHRGNIARPISGTRRSCCSRRATSGFRFSKPESAGSACWCAGTSGSRKRRGSSVSKAQTSFCIPTGWVWTPPPLYDSSGTCMAAYLTMTAAHANNVFIATADRIGTERCQHRAFMGSLADCRNERLADRHGTAGSQAPMEDTILYADIDIVQARTALIWEFQSERSGARPPNGDALRSASGLPRRA